MGTLGVQTGSRGGDDDPAPASLVLPASCVIGRSQACDLVIADRSVSAQHATLEWSGLAWELRDLGSRNGTIVDGRRLATGGRVALTIGSRLQFGADPTMWCLREGSAPVLMARHLASFATQLAEGGHVVLPDAGAPICSLYQDVHGAWVVERDGETVAVADRTVIAVGADLWRIHLPSALATLQVAGKLTGAGDVILLTSLCLRFTASQDEEHVEIVAVCGARRWDLQARAHHYMLLVLARGRLADRAAGVSLAEEGWIHQDDLLRMLRTNENHLHISIHRARAQLGKLGVADAAALVERRTGSRQIRLGVEAIELVAAR
jgi:hypothetical protein